MADEDPMAEILDEFAEPGAVTAGLDPGDHLADEGGVKSADVIPFVDKLGGAYLAAGRVAVTNSLLTRVEVDSTIGSRG